MNNSRQFLALARLYQSQIRNASASGNVVAAPSPRFQKLKEAQKKFGIEDDVPIYLKSGFGDRILFLTTFGLTLLGFGLSLDTFIRVGFGKSS